MAEAAAERIFVAKSAPHRDGQHGQVLELQQLAGVLNAAFCEVARRERPAAARKRRVKLRSLIATRDATSDTERSWLN